MSCDFAHIHLFSQDQVLKAWSCWVNGSGSIPACSKRQHPFQCVETAPNYRDHHYFLTMAPEKVAVCYCLNLCFFNSYWCEICFLCVLVNSQFFYADCIFKSLLCGGFIFLSWRTCLRIFLCVADMFCCAPFAFQSYLRWFRTYVRSFLFLVINLIGLFLYVFCLYGMLRKSPLPNSKIIHPKYFQMLLCFYFYLKLLKTPGLAFDVWCEVRIFWNFFSQWLSCVLIFIEWSCWWKMPIFPHAALPFIYLCQSLETSLCPFNLRVSSITTPLVFELSCL